MGEVLNTFTLDAGPPEGLPSSQSRQYSTVPGLPPIKEKRFPGLRRLWGSASRSSSQRAPSVSSAASSEQESVVDQIWPTRVSQRGPSVSSMASSNHESALEQLFPAARKASSVSSVASTSQEAALQQLWPRATKASSPASSVASELDSAQALARSRSKVLAHISSAIASHFSPSEGQHDRASPYLPTQQLVCSHMVCRSCAKACFVLKGRDAGGLHHHMCRAVCP